MAKLTPMMQQYLEIKENHKDCILFFRLGDFYEMFFEDAITTSRELEIALTGRECGQAEKAPMCGVPFHAAENYVQKLIQKGYKVAICEQVETPAEAKGIVKREVVRIVTPGTNLNTSQIGEANNNYIISISKHGEKIGLASCDITTGEFLVTEIEEESKLLDEIAKFAPSEILICEDEASSLEIEQIEQRFQSFVNRLPKWRFESERCHDTLCKQFKVITLNGLGLQDYSIGIIAAGVLMEYLIDTQKRALNHITKITPYTVNAYMMLDIASRRNLELTETLREKQRKGSLLWVLDKTRTAMGGRLIRKWIEQPLVSKKAIDQRLTAVGELIDMPIEAEELKEELDSIYDIERLLGRIAYGSANGRDLIALKSSISVLPRIKAILTECKSGLLKDIYEELDVLEDIYQLVNQGISDEPPISLREGKIIKTGYNEGVDNLRRASTEGKTWIAELEVKEREKTGIKNLKIKYNKVFGYYLEVTKSYYDLVPEHYTRKQTLANAERYIIPELKEIEDTILGAEDKIVVLEYELFQEIREQIASEIVRIQKAAYDVSQIDVIRSLSEVALKQNYVKPEISLEGDIDIKDGRHPVVEKMLSLDSFIPNDTYLNQEDNRLAIITGPNMAGKSTYMRQVALIVLMAQIGSYVPATEAKIAIVDRIFTRVGASDDLASGQSTFMVEMTEVSNILNNATEKSLLILDEIGRGTSTFDGLSIAWAVIEYVSNKSIIGAKTLFATHYHELTELEGQLEGVKNYCVSIKENGEDIIFLRKIKRGGLDHSYGIEVAKLAGLPETVVDRAKAILKTLNDTDVANIQVNNHVSVIEEVAPTKEMIVNEEVENTLVKEQEQKQNNNNGQINLFDFGKDQTIISKLKSMDIMGMTPMEAMNALYELQKEVKSFE